MKQEEIIEGNKRIAKFMGHSQDDHLYGMVIDDKYYTYTLMKYHSSWDWLMPIWKKIVDIGDSLMSQERNLYFKEITHGLYICDIQVVWSGIVEFIEWYNQSKQI